VNLTICIACSHPFTEHESTGCQDISDWSDDGYPEVCPCEKTAASVLRQVVPPVSEGLMGDSDGRSESI
jgi:hypothetical protein